MSSSPSHRPGDPGGAPPGGDSVARWLAELGRRVARGRLRRNWSQAELARRSGVSLRTVVRLESGASAQLANWLQVLDALGWGSALLDALPDGAPSPLEQLESRGSERRRSRAPGSPTRSVPWSWGLDTGPEDEEDTRPGPEEADDDRR